MNLLPATVTDNTQLPMTTKSQTVQDIISKPLELANDDRGIIEQLPVGESMSVLHITSRKGTVRANHYHQKDFHYSYLTRGKIRYVEQYLNMNQGKPMYDKNAPLIEHVIEPGQIFYTAPMIAHAMEFLEDSEFYAFTPRSGNQVDYEDDIVRVMVIDPEQAKLRATQTE
jgi:dTDP-4-dehydrorhamnose 3,5-epimerase-like enzyme